MFLFVFYRWRSITLGLKFTINYLLRGRGRIPCCFSFQNALFLPASDSSWNSWNFLWAMILEFCFHINSQKSWTIHLKLVSLGFLCHNVPSLSGGHQEPRVTWVSSTASWTSHWENDNIDQFCFIMVYDYILNKIQNTFPRIHNILTIAIFTVNVFCWVITFLLVIRSAFMVMESTQKYYLLRRDILVFGTDSTLMKSF